MKGCKPAEVPESALCTAASKGEGARGADTARVAAKALLSPRMPRSCTCHNNGVFFFNAPKP